MRISVRDRPFRAMILFDLHAASADSAPGDHCFERFQRCGRFGRIEHI